MRACGSKWLLGLTWLSDSRGSVTGHHREHYQGAADGSFFDGRVTSGPPHLCMGSWKELECFGVLGPVNLNVLYLVLIDYGSIRGFLLILCPTRAGLCDSNTPHHMLTCLSYIID